MPFWLYRSSWPFFFGVFCCPRHFGFLGQLSSSIYTGDFVHFGNLGLSCHLGAFGHSDHLNHFGPSGYLALLSFLAILVIFRDLDFLTVLANLAHWSFPSFWPFCSFRPFRQFLLKWRFWPI